MYQVYDRDGVIKAAYPDKPECLTALLSAGYKVFKGGIEVKGRDNAKQNT